MSSGPLCIVLDPIGYKYAEEDGIAFHTDANELWAKAALKPEGGFFSVRQSPWLQCACRQFSDDWWKSPDRTQHLLREDAWDFGANITRKRDYINAKEVGVATNPGDESMFINVPSNAGGAPLLVNFYNDGVPGGPGQPPSQTSLRTALVHSAPIYLPGDLVVVACTKQVIPGFKTPFAHLGAYAKPDEIFIFGCGAFAFVLTRRVVYVLRCSDDLKNWTFLCASGAGEKWLRNSHRDEFVPQGTMSAFDYGGNPPPYYVDHDVVFHDFGIVQDGFGSLAVCGLAGEQFAFRVRGEIFRDPTLPDLGKYMLGDGKWWFACSKDRQLYVQIEKSAYAQAEHITDFQVENPPSGVPDFNTIPKVIGPLMFDFGGGYKPTAAPEMLLDVLIHAVPVDSDTPDNVVEDLRIGGSDGPLYGKQITNVSTHEVVKVELCDEELQPWNNTPDDPARRHSSGYMRIRLTPADDFESAPQLGGVQVKFDAVIVPRLRSLADPLETTITEVSQGPSDGIFAAELHWQNLRVGCSCKDFLGKTIEFEISETVYQLIQPDVGPPTPTPETALAPYVQRQKFPFEIREDTNSDGSYETTRIAGWVDKIELATEDWSDADGDGIADTITRTWSFHCYGLAKRLDHPWLFLSPLEEPANNGQLSHVNAVKLTLKQAGIDPEDPRFFFAADDAGEPVGARYLPGDLLHQTSVAGMRKRKNPYAPSAHQLRSDYCETVAHGWSGRQLFERLDGQILYIRDTIRDIFFLGENPAALPPIRATIYRSQDEAQLYAASEVAAGRVGGLYMLDDPRPKVIPLAVQANCVAVYSHSQTGDLVIPVIYSDDNSIRGVKQPDGSFSAAYENFVGERKVLNVELDFAIDDFSALMVAQAMLSEALLRGELFQFATPFLPWQMARPQPPFPNMDNDVLDQGDSLAIFGYSNAMIIHAELAINAREDWATIYTAFRWPTPRASYQQTP